MSPNPEGESSRTQRRSTRACDNCKSRRTRCEYDNDNISCKSCVENGLECTFMAPVRKRGPQAGGRKGDRRSASPRSSDRWSTKPKSPENDSQRVSPPYPRRTLPFGGVPSKLVDQLLPLYFTHNVWPLVYKATFNPHTAPSPLLLSMLAIAACVTPLKDGDSFPSERLFRMAEQSLHESRNECRIDLIQSLLLLSLRQTGCGDKQSASMYAGRACCMALNMGLNLAPGGLGKLPDPTEQEIRSRVYWNTYVLDKTLAEETGRPFLLTYRRTTTALPSTSELEEFEAWPPPTISATISSSVGVIPRRGHVLSCFAWTCRLAMVVEGVLEMDPTCPPMTTEWDNQFLEDLPGKQQYMAERPATHLDGWYRALPLYLNVDGSASPLPHHAVLLAWYHTTRILYHSRFIRSKGIAQSPMVNTSLQPISARQACSDAAQATIAILTLLDRHNLLTVASADVLHILSLTALFEAKVNFAQCCIWLREFSKSWPAASSHRLFFEGLIKGGLHLSSTESDQPSDPLPGSGDTAASPSLPAGLHAIRRNLSISGNVSPIRPDPSDIPLESTLNPSNLFQLPQLYWNHFNTGSNFNNALGTVTNTDSTWNSDFDIGLNTNDINDTFDTNWNNQVGGVVDMSAENWLESLTTSSGQPDNSISGDAVQSALMSFMIQAGRGG
ncbi:uncharacterized protein I206_101703 [Kwoniella pini CBS 10737]|uniref:Zn(2)-C6 fungal-type domain-containing protein n=1 Tax=Kwoniella pini CBS 10737 TaxID=1296096 RepID=A0AAJ8L2K6_9TREE